MATQRLLFLTPAQAVTGIFPALRDAGFELGIAENLKGASAFISKSGPGIIFARPTLPGFRVEDLLAVGAEDPHFPPVIVVADKGSPQEAERLLNLGARDYWLEPLDVERVKIAAGAARRQPAPAPAASTLGGRRPVCPQGAGPRIVGNHPSIRRVLQLARQVAPSRATVLITGASGTGKEMFARYLHAMSPRAARPFVAVNCAALPEHLLESELFGHEKGAFTGAIARKPGKFELADGGTLLLDEISEMDLALQAKLLRVLQEGEVDRVGGTETLKVDVRVLATTNRNLEEWVAQGKFRQDLYFRLNVIPLRLPSLHQRGDDVLDELDADRRDALLGRLTRESSEELRSLLNFDPDSAGGVMNTELILLEKNFTADEAIAHIRSEMADKESPYYAYVVDAQHVLVGVLSLRDLMLARPGTVVGDAVAGQSVVSVT